MLLGPTANQQVDQLRLHQLISAAAGVDFVRRCRHKLKVVSRTNLLLPLPPLLLYHRRMMYLDSWEEKLVVALSCNLMHYET